MHHIVVKVIFFKQSSESRLHILIDSGSIYLWRNIVIYSVNYPFHSESTMEYWHLPWRGNCLYFGPGLLGTLGIDCLSLLHEHVLTLIKETSTESKERCWILCSPLHICAKWACTVLYFYIYLLIDAPVPTFYDVSYKARPFTFTLPHHSLTLFGLKLRDSFAHQVKDGPREVDSLSNCYPVLI